LSNLNAVEIYGDKRMRSKGLRSKGILIVAVALYTLSGCGGGSSGNSAGPNGNGGEPIGTIWSTMSPMPTPRLEFATAAAGGLIFVIAGRDALAAMTPKPQVATMEIYDPANDTWSAGPDLPIAVSGLMVVGLGDKIYAMGGELATALPSSALFEFDSAIQTWTQLADMPVASQLSAVAGLDGEILVSGGHNAGFQVADLYRYNLAMDTWTVGTPMSDAREGARGVGINGRYLVYGGKTATHTQDAGYRRVLQSYDPITDMWTTLEPGEPRGDFGIAVVNGLVHTFGGSNVARTLDWVRAYDPVANTWTAKTALPMELGFTRAETIGDDILVFSTDGTLMYTPANDPQ
jgi:non-specific serine/threonine protein kinase